MKKKIKLLIFALIICLIAEILIPVTEHPIISATVNLKNGDIAFTYYSRENSLVILTVCDSAGNMKFEKTIKSGNSNSRLGFYNDCLSIMYLASSKPTVIAYDMNGNETSDNKISIDDLRNTDGWVDWQKISRSKYYYWEEKTYCYECQPFPQYLFNRGCSLYIINSHGEKNVLYENGVVSQNIVSN